MEKYELSDVFTQSVENFKLIFDHSRVLTKLQVRDLIASCCDFLQEQVISEQKSANARKQQGIEVPTRNSSQGHAPLVKKEENRGFTPSQGAMTIKQARAFMTEAASTIARQPLATQTGGGTAKVFHPQGPTGPREFLVAFIKHPSYDINCEGCGKWYKNAPGNRFPNPCSGKCQYEGHPLLNQKYQQGVKWKHPGYCCSWKGVSNNDIPPSTLARLQKYVAQKREREPTY